MNNIQGHKAIKMWCAQNRWGVFILFPYAISNIVVTQNSNHHNHMNKMQNIFKFILLCM